MIDYAFKIMTSLGYAERGSDLFFVTLSGGFPSCRKVEISECIKSRVLFSETEDYAIKNGIHSLVNWTLCSNTSKGKLREQILLN